MNDYMIISLNQDGEVSIEGTTDNLGDAEQDMDTLAKQKGIASVFLYRLMGEEAGNLVDEEE